MIPNIKIYKKERIYDFNLEEYIYEIKPEYLSKYKLKVVHNEPNIFWRQKTWDLAIYRSMEIWRKIPANKLENSIGELTALAKRSLSGKMGTANGKYFKKDKDNNWNFIKPKEAKYEKVFLPLSEEAIMKCRERAKKYLC
ncbi:hypothetical protein [uncultured Polaribacter sp.]|uniref:hypothetical protein n=1 Tax=uncultured Polaribacter sp. TaxID=174711 RepID=UPI00262E2EC9|nr:hypothetical protein [uncultured Polaribacter sp.]